MDAVTPRATAVPASLVIIDLLSHQGPHDNAAVLVHEALSNKLVDPGRLFLFSDLSPLRVALSAAERVAEASAALSTHESQTESAADVSRTMTLLSSLLDGLGAYSKRGKKDFPFLAHAVRGEGQARVAALLKHAFTSHPDLCATEPVNSLEALHEALARFVATTVAPRIAGSPTTLVLLSHGGTAMLNAPGRLDGPAVLGVGNSGDEHGGRTAVLDPAWLAREVALPLARAASTAPGGRLLWAQVGAGALKFMHCEYQHHWPTL